MPAESYTPDPALVELLAEAMRDANTPEAWSVGRQLAPFYHFATVALAALATEPDLWQYGMPDLDEGPAAVMTFEGKPRIITPRMVRRPLRAVGPWLPAPTETKEN